MALEIFETTTQFIKIEDGIKIPDTSKTYEIRFSNDMYNHYLTTFSQFELEIKTGGDWGWSSYFCLCYRGFCFTPKYSETQEGFILSLLNDLKRGKYHEKMSSLIETSIGKEKFDFIKGILNKPNIRAEQLEKELFEKEEQINNLQKELSTVENLRSEIEILRKKLIEIKIIIGK